MKFKYFIILGMSSAVFAHDGATGLVKERMDAMSSIGQANKQLSEMARGKAEINLETVKNSAATIAEHSGINLTDLFPEGTIHAPSDAKEEIWQQWDKFSMLSSQMETAATDLQTASDEDFATKYRALSNTCRQCHKAFRK